MSFSKHQGNDAVCYTKPLDSLKGWNDHFFWVDAFACPASFPWNTNKSMSKDPFPKCSEYNAEHYATLVAYPAPFHKYPEPFLCLVGISRNYTLDENTYPQFVHDNDEEMDFLSFIRTADPTKVRVGKRQCAKDEPKLLDTTVGRVVSLLPIAPARAESELEASVDKLFDKGGSVIEAVETVVEDAAPIQPRHQKKRKTMVVDSSEPSHPAKRLRDDHGTPGGPIVGGKLRSAVQRLLARAVQNAEVRGEAMPTLPFVTSSVSSTPEREGRDHTESLAGANLQVEVDYVVRTSVLIMTSVTTNTTPNLDHAVIAKEKLVGSSMFSADSSAGGSHPIPGGFSDSTGSDFLIGGIHTFIDPDSNLQKVYVPKWNVTNGSLLDDGGVCREMMSLSIEVWMRAEYNIKEKRRLKSIVNEQTELLKAREKENESLKEQLLLKEAEAIEAIRLRAKASKLEVVEKSLRDEPHVLKERNTTLEKEKGELEVKVADLTASVKVKEQEVANLNAMVTSVKSQNDNLVDQDDKMKEVNDKFDKLYTDFFEMALHLKEKFYPHLLTTIFWRRWLLTHDMELAIAKCLNSTEYLSTLRAAIGKAVEKGMQDGLFAGIIHGAEGRNLTDVDAYNPSTEVDYISALQHLQSVNFSLITELRSNKDARVEMIMNLFHLEDTIADRLGLTESQPHVDQLMVPIHHSLDQHVIGASALSLSLDPLSAIVLPGMEGTSDVIPATADTTMTLSVTFSSVGTVTPISVDNYEVTGADDHTIANDSATNRNVDPFFNVDDMDLNIL
ncbi:hypothetical protein Tco_0586815 [Tanacetum coccineum]